MINKDSKLYRVIKKRGKPFFDHNFIIIESIDDGMGKYCLLQAHGLQIMIIYEKVPIYVDICSLTRDYCRADKRHGDYKWIDLVHLANYLNDKQKKYLHPNFYWVDKIDCNQKYIQFYGKILEKCFVQIRGFMDEISYSSYQEFIRYAKKQNEKLWVK